jgi:type VI secretion system FHA domain protein
MILELQLIKQPAGELPPQKNCQFVEQGGTIGRAEHCEFVLADQTKGISKAHALVHYRDGAYFLTDVSSNGVFVNNDPIPIGKGNTKQILQGDQFQMGDYVLQATIGNSAQAMQSRKVEQDEIEKLLSNKDDLSDLLAEEISAPTAHASVNRLHSSEQSIDAILNTLSRSESSLNLNEIGHNMLGDDSDDILAELVGGSKRSTNFNSGVPTHNANAEQLADQLFSEILTYISPEKFAGMFSNVDGAVYTEENFKLFCDALQENKELIVAGVLDKLNRK